MRDELQPRRTISWANYFLEVFGVGMGFSSRALDSCLNGRKCSLLGVCCASDFPSTLVMCLASPGFSE